VRAIGWAVWFWFFVGWITGELAIWCIGLQVVFVAAWVLIAGTDTAGFSWGLSFFLATWVLLAVFLRDALDAGATFSRSLRMALGVGFLEERSPISCIAKSGNGRFGSSALACATFAISHIKKRASAAC
jgi:hypothetical protein